MNKFWVFDTNVLVSAVLEEKSATNQALLSARSKGTLLISEEVNREYFRVFTKPKFEKYLSLETRMEFIENILSTALNIEITEHVTACRDPRDNMFLSLAKSAMAECIITGDTDLLVLNPFLKIPIVTPTEFLKKF